jgi:hypothetical protein
LYRGLITVRNALDSGLTRSGLTLAVTKPARAASSREGLQREVRDFEPPVALFAVMDASY